ncbi:M48 family metallopeptidase [Undibacterium crateris]|uniref:M48 family metallopeptidase n=1 Tax=Undibacterium crateris TaxID=2528175 RepID=UPI001F3D4453|nr:SprT family zinc-dependent metalloprotease [Undibacterium crateris]
MALQLDLFSEILPSGAGKPGLQPSATPAALPNPLAELSPPAATPSASDTASGNKLRKMVLADCTIHYELLRSKRRSIGFLIHDGGLRVTAPRWVTISDIEHAISEKQGWIQRKLSERRERVARRLEPAMQWQDGAQFPFLGQTLTLRISPGSLSGTFLDQAAAQLHIHVPANAAEQQIRDRVQGWLQQEAKRLFQERLPVFADKLGVQYRSMSLSAAQTRWGSCTSDGKIRLNWRLIHFSPMIIDYVIAHELAHLREMNHSPRFWATVQSVFPEMEQARHQLKQQSTADLPAF